MPPPSSTAASGVLESAFHRLISRRARVRDVEVVGGAFRLVTLEGEDLRGHRWVPGDMIQIGFSGFLGRAYTPLSFDAGAGTLSFLGFVHGDGIASRWLASAKPGEELHLVGPRAAIDLAAVTRPLIFFGDETSLSTAAALDATRERTRGVASFFEVDSAEASRAALGRVGATTDPSLTVRSPGDRHLDGVEDAVVSALRAAPNARCVFTGKASSIQRLYKAARRAGLSSKQVKNVAYWAPGRRGFSGVQR